MNDPMTYSETPAGKAVAQQALDLARLLTEIGVNPNTVDRSRYPVRLELTNGRIVLRWMSATEITPAQAALAIGAGAVL